MRLNNKEVYAMSDKPASNIGILRKSEKRNIGILSLRADGRTAKLGRAIPMLVDCFVAKSLLAMTSLQRTEISFL